MIALLVVFVLPWLALGVIGHGFLYSSLQNEFPEYAEADEASDFWLAAKLIPSGPVFLLIILLRGYTDYGLRFRRYKYIDGVRQ